MTNVIHDYILGKAIGLPPSFLALEEGSKGGGVIEVNSAKILFDLIYLCHKLCVCVFLCNDTLFSGIS